MDVVEQLDALRKTSGGIESVAYVDFRSGTVLCASSAISQPQEQLDRFCTIAKRLLNGPLGERQVARIVALAEAVLVIRSPRDPAEALCLVAAPDTGDLEPAARRTLNELPE